jgi:hypothetical protein
MNKRAEDNSLASRSIILFENLIVAQLVEKIPAFYEIRWFTAVFTRSHRWSLS